MASYSLKFFEQDKFIIYIFRSCVYSFEKVFGPSFVDPVDLIVIIIIIYILYIINYVQKLVIYS